MNRFRVYGLEVSTTVPFEGLGLLKSEGETVSVEISEGEVPERLINPEIDRRFCQVSQNEFLLWIPDIGRFLVTGGSSIVIDRAPGVAANDTAPYVLGSCFGALLQQRRNVALHGAGVCIDGRAFLICGLSGAGKSTTTAHLCANGGSILCDDLAVVGADPPFLVQPGFAQTRLADNAATDLGLEFDSEAAKRAPTGKLVVSTADHFVENPCSLAGILVIERTKNEKLGLDRIPQKTAMEVLRRHTYRRKFITRDVAQSLFSKWGRLATAVPVWQLTRPDGRDTTSEVVALAEQAMKKMQQFQQERQP